MMTTNRFDRQLANNKLYVINHVILLACVIMDENEIVFSMKVHLGKTSVRLEDVRVKEYIGSLSFVIQLFSRRKMSKIGVMPMYSCEKCKNRCFFSLNIFY